MRTGEASSSSTELAARRRRTEAGRLRSFGLVVGGALGVLALWPVLFRHQGPSRWLLAVAAALAATALALPASLKHVYRAWMAFGHALGWINTRILLFVIFYLVLTPLALVRRWLGKDSMRRSFEPDLETYRVKSTPRAETHMRRQH